VKRLVDEAHERANRVLEARRDLLDRLADLLMVIEVIEGSDLNEYVQGTKPIPTAEEARARLVESGNGRRTPSGPDIIIGQRQTQPIPPPPPAAVDG
jgi:hypothetical protein